MKKLFSFLWIKNFRVTLFVISIVLIFFSYLINNFRSTTTSPQKIQFALSETIHQQEKDFDSFLKSDNIWNKIASNQYGNSLMQSCIDKSYFLFFYSIRSDASEKLIFWNTQKVIAPSYILYSNENIGFVILENGYYVWNKIQHKDIIAIALIPVKWNYFIENEHLQNHFVIDANLSDYYNVSKDDKNGKLIKSISGKPLFYINEKSWSAIEKNNSLALFLYLLGLLLLLIDIHYTALHISKKHQPIKGILFFICCIFFLRGISYFFNQPINFRAYDLFNPAIYASGHVLKSLGDLLINGLLFTWIVLFIRLQLFQIEKTKKIFSNWRKWLVLFLLSSIIICINLSISKFIKSLIVDAQIPFDVIDFFSLNIFSVVAFFIICLLSLSCFYICQVGVKLFNTIFPNSIFILLIAVVSIGLLLLSFDVIQMQGSFEIFTLLWTVVFLLLIHAFKSKVITSKIINTKLIFWFAFFSLSNSFIIISENKKKELSLRKNYAETLAIKSNPANETLINSMLLDYQPNFMSANFYRFYNPISNAALKDSFMGISYSGYANKFDTRIFTFSADEKSLFNNDSSSYSDINTILNTQARPTGYSGLYYFDQAFDEFSYLNKQIIKDTSDQLLGYVFVISTPKLQRKDALYPELFTKGKPFAIENSNTYAFALYNNGHLTSSYNDYPFASVVDIQKNKVQTFNVVKNDDYTELWYYAGAGKMVVIAKENNSFVAFITLFSYLFCTFLIVFVLLWTIQRLSNRFDFNYFKFWQISIRNQIHGTIFLVSIISFLVIGIATVFFFVNRYESNNREKLSRVIRIMEKEIKSTFLNETMAQDSSVLDLTSNKIKLEQLVEKVSNIHGVDVNLYDLNGDLQVSSLSLPYNKGILSTKMNPMAFYHLHKKREIQFFQKEKIGNLNYISSYIPINSVKGDSYGYLNIPFFTSQNLLRQEISNFLITIINLNAFIFLLAGIVSLFITNRIANSFSIITEKMQKVNLGKVNEPIKWNRNDEIGALVIEYNKMMAKLEESAAILAKTEREGAWKEMARQVAHEIKNPLTPMKLSMQYLQKSIDNDSPNIIPLAKNVSETLIQQIDHLSNIANAFSQFANIGEAKKEVFDINEVLKNVTMLHELNESLEINKMLIDTPTMVKADKTQINRLFTNLLLNAIQSIPENRLPQISIKQEIKSEKIIIAVSDNGLGISEEVKYNIFAPNFTTKTSGTGLGLAMCKRIVEQSDGEIWFETELGVGTSFFVELPLVG